MKRALLLVLLAACGAGQVTEERAPALPPPPAPNVRIDERFVVALDLAALRATPSGAKVLRSLGRSQASSNERLGYSPLEEASWMTTAGPEIAFISTGHAAVVAHGKSEEEARRIISRAGGVGGEVSLYGARGVVMRKPGLFVFAPDGALPSTDRRRGDEAVRIAIRKLIEPWWPTDMGAIEVKARLRDGLDLEGRAVCPSAERCSAVAADLRQRIVKLDAQAAGVTHDAFVPLEKNIVADDTTLKATLHLDPEQLRILSDLALAYLGLP